MQRRIIIADDHFLIRSGLRLLLEAEADLEVVGEAASGKELLDLLAGRSCDLVILDLTMPGMDGIAALERLKAGFPEIQVLVLTVHKNQEFIRKALNRGACGYVIKEEQEHIILNAVRKTLNGETAISTGFSQPRFTSPEPATPRREGQLATLSDRELQVLICVAQGHSSKMIGTELGISYTTVNKHIEHIKQKLGIHRKAALIRYALSKGLN